jgi:hypothetical protein
VRNALSWVIAEAAGPAVAVVVGGLDAVVLGGVVPGSDDALVDGMADEVDVGGAAVSLAPQAVAVSTTVSANTAR